MVSMGFFSRVELLTACAALAAFHSAFTTTVHAFPYAGNPFTPGGDSIALDAKHPAFGAEAPRDSLSFAAVVPTADGNGTVAAENREASANSDLQRLESFFKTKLVVNFEELTKVKSGASVAAPWPSSYWPTYEDGINFVWNPQDKMPPSEKYARAYGQDPKAFMQKVSQTSGVLAQSARPQCSSDSDCSRLKDGSGCGKRAGEKNGFCIPKWFGVCHAWAPAAIEEREPQCPVTKNGVTFQPFDIKALVTQAYDGLNLGTVFTGARYNGAESPENLDKDGRYQDATRRDMGPGFFHIAVHNIMGINKKSFIVDVDAGAQVWNQPVRSYDAYTAMEVTKEQALEEFFPGKNEYSFNQDAKKLIFVQMQFKYIIEASENGPLVSTGKVDSYTTLVYYEYLLELDGNGDIIGGEWVRQSKKTHPDFLWFPETAGVPGSVSNIGIKYDEVRELLDASADCKAIDAATDTPSSPTTTSPVPATSDTAGPQPGLVPVPVPVPAPTPTAFDIGTVVSADSLSEVSNLMAEWVRRWMGNRGRVNGGGR